MQYNRLNNLFKSHPFTLINMVLLFYILNTRLSSGSYNSSILGNFVPVVSLIPIFSL